MRTPVIEDRKKPEHTHILVVDSDETVGRNLTEVLPQMGFFVDAAPNGQRAIHGAREFFYNIVLAEVELPDMRGVDLLRMIKGIHPDTAVILMTGSPSLENSVEALNGGVSAYLMKPIHLETLLRHIAQVLERQKIILETRELLFEERKKREFYQYLSIRDGLTGLYNHRHFHELLNTELAPAARYGQPLSLFMIDIDNFKQFNDTYGHPAGDSVLQQLARLLRENCRRMDHVFRYGGEEFAIISPQTCGKNALNLAKRLLNRVRQSKIQLYGGAVEEKLTISIGMATYPAHANNRHELIQEADQFLLMAKKSGKDCFYPTSL